ncbi:MAG: hypothetical protein ACOYNC_16370 [Bacteroidales bacterium]|jgi:hypothetical protein
MNSTKTEQRTNKKRTKASKKQNYFERNKEFISFFQKIPYGTSRILCERLIAKHGKAETYSLNYINMVLDPDNPRFNKKIMNEALAHFAEARIDQLKAREIMMSFIPMKTQAVAE